MIQKVSELDEKTLIAVYRVTLERRINCPTYVKDLEHLKRVNKYRKRVRQPQLQVTPEVLGLKNQLRALEARFIELSSGSESLD